MTHSPPTLASFDIDKLMPLGVTLATVVLVVLATRWLLERQHLGQSFASQITMLAVLLVAVLAIVLALPVDAPAKSSVLNVLGIVLSAVIALSSSTIMGNALAGLMLRSLNKFKVGDYIRCGDYFGNVKERGLVHTEIQTEDSDLVTIPNLFLVTNPLTTVRATSTLISATVSLGYDVPRENVRRQLLLAAEQVKLGKPFVRVTALGDFSVGYRVAGVLEPVEELDWNRSRLRCAMLDALHGAGIEIVSPNFMNQRQVAQPVLPPTARVIRSAKADAEGRSDEIVFAEAKEAQSVESATEELVRVEAEIADLEKRMAAADEADDSSALQRQLGTSQRRRAALVQVLNDAQAHRAAHP